MLTHDFPGQQQGGRPGRPLSRTGNLSHDPIGQRQAHRQRDLTRCIATRITPWRRGERPPQIRNAGRSGQAGPRGRQATQLKRRRNRHTRKPLQVITHVRGLDRTEQRAQHHNPIPRLPPRQHPQVPQRRRDDSALCLGQRLTCPHIVPVRGIRELGNSQPRRRAAGESPSRDPTQTSPSHRTSPERCRPPTQHSRHTGPMLITDEHAYHCDHTVDISWHPLSGTTPQGGRLDPSRGQFRRRVRRGEITHPRHRRCTL